MLTQRQRIVVRGLVQGVGFRPFVYRLAHALQLTGWARNDGQGVTIEVDGSPEVLTQFEQRLRQDAPPLAQIESIDVAAVTADTPLSTFDILHSEASPQHAASIGADTAICPACLAELFDPSNRRYRYAFINCTDCGPRYTLVSRLPYDRANTSMARFAQCAPCLHEYRDPAHRRFHAEPNACPDCGPALQLRNATGGSITGDAIAQTLALLNAGQIVAIKGLGGFHLVCDARNASAVARLRECKQREEKPLAVMVANVASLAELAQISDAEQQWLESAARPIVLLQKQARTDDVLKGIAPQVNSIGTLLPYTPTQYLLFHEAAGRPAGLDWLQQPQALVLVMTSANPHGEPLVIDNAQAMSQLAGIADAYLLHNRDIVIRCDDSVLQLDTTGAPQIIRRARGYTPQAIRMAKSTAPILALGGFFNAALCLSRSDPQGDQAFLSQYIGDLDRVANCRALQAATEHLMHLLQVQPQLIAHDLHPDFFSSQLAQRLAAEWQIPTLAVQHHRAHLAAVMAEHQLEGPVLGLALDGIGLGEAHDALGADVHTAWGGELLLVDDAQYQRLGHLRPLAMPGGDKAAREPWRMAAAVLAQLGRGDEIATRFAGPAGTSLIAQLLAHNPQQTSSMGRYFDAAAGLLGVSTVMSFEAQAAMQLEGLAAQYGPLRLSSHETHLFKLQQLAGLTQLDLLPLLGRLADCADVAYGAALFHAVLIESLAQWLGLTAERQGICTVVAGGGCLFNQVLVRGLRAALAKRGLRLYTNQMVPCGDGGLALGQLWVAQRRMD
jgi:hydrogenase maturation protein HypF